MLLHIPLLALAITAQVFYGDGVQQTPVLKKVAKLFEATFLPTELTAAQLDTAIEALVAKSYIQHVNGDIYDYSYFVQHIGAVRAKVQIQNITFTNSLESKGTVGETHTVGMINLKTKETSLARVIAVFRVDPNTGLIVSCDESTT